MAHWAGMSFCPTHVVGYVGLFAYLSPTHPFLSLFAFILIVWLLLRGLTLLVRCLALLEVLFELC